MNTRKKVVFPSICVEGNVKEIVQYRAKFPSVSEKSSYMKFCPTLTAHFLYSHDWTESDF